MQQEGLSDVVVKTFEYYYTQLVEGQTGMISEADIEPVASLPDAETFSADLAEAGQAVMPQTVLIKLNGGLGTSMGLEKAKSLLTVKNGLTFLDIIAQQAMRANIPFVLMNSFVTRDDSLAALEQYDDLKGAIPLDFVQNKIPKITQADFSPAEWPADPHLEWCPPGHGDIYTALVTSQMLDTLLEAGYKYAFVSNSDNLGAVMDTAILGYFAQNNLPFMMEVADRTEADKKGGHLAQLPDGQLILRESAQCPPDDTDHFQNVSRHKYFNTNNLWLNLPALKEVLTANDNILGLPMIRNSKTVDPRDSSSTPVYQLETAMGSAIGVFEGAGAVRVPRIRFAPVKATSDLLAVRSDAYILTDD
ncbi:MAG: UTP--glucose-1-phosphate uridylyltransferase, partial [Anaerolineae bacterium]|nr:UTP--glucose-1-phosphate uridylyltransferase [Anaerolineae bacterium]